MSRCVRGCVCVCYLLEGGDELAVLLQVLCVQLQRA